MSFIILFVLLFTAGFFRNIVWETELRLWKDVVMKSPEKGRGYNDLGLAYYYKGDLGEAIKEYIFALKINPDYAKAYNNLGIAYFDKGLFDEAMEQYKTALKIKPDYPQAHYNLGNAYKIKGLKDRAREEFETVLKLKPDNQKAIKAIELLDKGF